MQRSIAVFVLLAVWLGAPAAAQEQRGSIEGVAKDTSGAVLPGVTIEARTAAGVVLTATTEDHGVFRFPALAPGSYDVTATLAGFRTIKFERVEVLLGQIKRLEFMLEVAGVAETVQVTGESPLVDVKQSARATSWRGEQLDLLPQGRDFASAVALISGANAEDKQSNTRQTGLQIDGSSGSENRYVVDGMEFTDPQRGNQGNARIVTDFLDEVQVKSSGYTAEYGGSTGGVVNILTRSGTNRWRGNAFLYAIGSALEGGRRPSLRLNPQNSQASEYVTYSEDSWRQMDPGGSIGGPIRKDTMWFWAGYAPTLQPRDRTVTNLTTGEQIARTQQQTQQNLSANYTAQVSNSIRSRVAFNYSPYAQDGRLPALDGSDSPLALYTIKDKFPTWALSGNMDWVLKPSMFLGVRGGYWTTDQNTTGVPNDTRYLFSTTNIAGGGDYPADIPLQYQRVGGFQNVITNRAVDRNQYYRVNLQGDGTFYFNARGSHMVKTGVQYDRVNNDVLDAEQQNLVTIRWGRSLPTGVPLQRGPYGYYSVRSNGLDPQKGFTVTGSIYTTNVGLFVQDAWSVTPRLTVNLGLRTEYERIPPYQRTEGAPEYPIRFSFADKLAPRAGFAWDVKGDGTWKAYGSWGVFYDIFKLTLPRGSFGADRWLEYYYTLDTYQWDTLDTPNCPPACPGTLIRGPIDFRFPSYEDVDPDLKPMRLQETSVGLEHQLSRVVAVSARYVHKQVDRGVEDIGYLDAQGNELYTIGNPGFGRATTCFAAENVACPKATRDYDAVELTFDKRLANNWMLRASYLWSRLYGNWSGLANSDENGRQDPNVSRAFDYPIMSFDGNGQPLYGRLATDRPNQVKAQFIYQLKWGTNLGVNQYVGSGTPITSVMAVLPSSNYPVYWNGRGDAGRTPVRSQTDLFVGHNFGLGGGRQVQVNFQVYNLLNQKTATDTFANYVAAGANGITFDEAAFYRGEVNFDQTAVAQGVPKDPRYLLPSAYQAPISARFGVRFSF